MTYNPCPSVADGPAHALISSGIKVQSVWRRSVQSVVARILLVSQDMRVIHNLCHLMEQLAMEVEICSDWGLVAGKLCKSKFDAIVVDFKNERATELLEKIHATTSHRRAVVIAILTLAGDVQEAFQAGANFVLERSLFPSIVNRTLRAAYPLMIRERRRYFRCPIRVPLYLATTDKSEIQVQLINVSEGGMAIESSSNLHVGTKIEWELTLPRAGRLHGLGEVCWNDNAGRLGIQFSHMHSSILESLQSWLLVQLQESFVLPAKIEHDVTFK